MSTKQTESGSLPPCAICHAKVAIYRCPRCHTCTCSLTCSRAHKVSKTNNEIVCNGKRDRTQFCSLKGFTDSQLASDYHFLEDVLKVSERSNRLYQGIVTGVSSASTSGSASTKRARGDGISYKSEKVKLDSISTEAPPHPLLRTRKGVVEILADGADDTDFNEQKKSHESNGITGGLSFAMPAAKPVPQKKEKIDPLKRQAELKGINLLRMPNGMERRRLNTTKMNKKKGIITWKIELCFHQPKVPAEDLNGSSHTLEKSFPKLLKVESEVSESSTLSEELGRHLDVHPGNSTTRSSLRAFANASRDSLLMFMKRLPCSSAAPQYFKLDPNATLMESLTGKTIIEFPTIDVVMETEKDCFPLFIKEI